MKAEGTRARRRGFEGRSEAVLLAALLLAAAFGLFLELGDDESFTTISGNSMQHGDARRTGVIDDGDGAVLEPVEREGLKTYYQGIEQHYRVAGDHGDAVAFKVNGGSQRYLHRLVVLIQFNVTRQGNGTADIPELGLFNLTTHVFRDYGFDHRDLYVNFTHLYDRMLNEDRIVTEGFLTAGDNRNILDQMSEKFVAPVRFEDILGRCRVVDNELVWRDIPTYLAMGSIIVLPLFAYLSWFFFNSRNRNLPGYERIVKAVLVVSLTIPMVNGLRMVSASSGAKSLVPLAVYAAIAMAVLCLGQLWRNWGVRAGREALAVLMLVLLVPGYFLMKADVLAFCQFLPLLAVIFSISHLEPSVYLAGIPREDVAKNLGLWSLLLGTNVVVFIFLLNITLPPVIFLFVGTCWGAAYCIRRLFGIRYKSLKEDTAER